MTATADNKPSRPVFRRQEDFEQWLEELAEELQKLKNVHSRQIVSLLVRHADVIGRLTVHQADDAFIRLKRNHLITPDEWLRVRMYGRSELPKWLFSRPRAISTKTWLGLPEGERVRLRNPSLKVAVSRANQVVPLSPEHIKDGEWRRIIWPSDPKAGIRPVDMRSGKPRSKAHAYHSEVDIINDPQFADCIIIVSEHSGRLVKTRVAFSDHMRRLEKIGRALSGCSAAG